MTEPVKVEVMMAATSPIQQLRLRLPARSSVRDALVAACEKIPVLCDRPIEDWPVGIFGRRVKLDDLVREGDRLEIYGPLIADPKIVRRLRAAASR